jgi:hypothetical protein
VTGQTSPGQRDRWDSGECPAGGLDRRSFLVAVIDWRHDRVIDRIVSEDGPSKVVFSPDGRLAYML